MLTWSDLELPPINLWNVPKQFYIKGIDMEDNYVTIHKSELEAFQAHDKLLKALFENGVTATQVYMDALVTLRENEMMEGLAKD
jgi:hypothetical protein